jgi:Uri superfamily endonuclease
MRRTYCLIIHYKGGRISIGKLGKVYFSNGYYVYVGSGLARIERHYRTKKKIKWHIDYLLRKARIVGFALSRKRECEVARSFLKEFPPVDNFGCSDCRCSSHLFYSKTFKKIEKFLDKL